MIERAVGLLSGYLLWIGLTRIATPEIIGTSSTVISIANIFTTVATIGVPIGVSRFLAKRYSEDLLEEARVFVKSSFILVGFGIMASFATLLVLRDWIFADLDENLMIFSILLVASSSFSFLTRSIIIATLKTKLLPKIMVIASSVRIILVIVLVLANFGAIGVVTGYISFEVLASMVLSFSIYGIYRSRDDKLGEIKLNYPFKSILSASIPSWIPKLVSILGGSNLGTIVVFGFNGAAQAASYFLANAIFSAISTISAPLFTVAYPALSAMSDGRKRLAWRILKISIILSLPLSASVFFYSDDIVQLLGNDYNDASLYLQIFMITILPNSINTMITQLVYAYGNYRQVMFLGLASSLPRTLLYFILVPFFGATGAVISFLVGSVTGLVASIIVAKKIDMKIDWKSLVFMTTVAFLPAFALSYFKINFVMGIIGTIILSFIIFLKLSIVTKYDIEDTLSVLPASAATPLISIMGRLGRLLNKSY